MVSCHELPRPRGAAAGCIISRSGAIGAYRCFSSDDAWRMPGCVRQPMRGAGSGSGSGCLHQISRRLCSRQRYLPRSIPTRCWRWTCRLTGMNSGGLWVWWDNRTFPIVPPIGRNVPLPALPSRPPGGAQFAETGAFSKPSMQNWPQRLCRNQAISKPIFRLCRDISTLL